MRVPKFVTFFGLSWIAAYSVAADHLEKYLDPNQRITFDLAQNDPLVAVQDGFLLLERGEGEVIVGESTPLNVPARELNAVGSNAPEVVYFDVASAVDFRGQR